MNHSFLVTSIGTTSSQSGESTEAFTSYMSTFSGINVATQQRDSYAFSATLGDVTSGRKAYAIVGEGPAMLMTSLPARITPGVDVIETGRLPAVKFIPLSCSVLNMQRLV